MRIPEGFIPTPQQWEQAEFLTAYDRGAVLSGVGTGKTAVVLLALGRIFGDANPDNVLLVVPSAIVGQWAAILRQWFPGVSVLPIRSGAAEAPALSTGVTIITYDLLPKAEAILKHSYRIVVADEAHYAKGITTDRAKALYRSGVVAKAEYYWPVTGTPIVRYADDVYDIFRLLVPHHAASRSVSAFRDLFTRQEMRRFGGGPNKLTVTGNSNLDLLWKALAGTYVRSMSVEGLPPLTVDRLPIAIKGSAARALWEAARQDPVLAPVLDAWKGRLDDPAFLFALGVALERASRDHIMRLRRMTGELKVPLLREFLVEQVAACGKVLVLVHHVDAVLEPLAADLRAALPHAAQVLTLHGGVTGIGRDAVIKRFSEDLSAKVLVMQAQAGGVGVDGLQNACWRIIDVEGSWSGAGTEQAYGRLHRRGQTRPVMVTRVILEHTLDAAVDRIADLKREGADAVFTTTDT